MLRYILLALSFCCLQTLGDPTAGRSTRLLRAQGLRELGSIFCSCAEAVLSQQKPFAKEEVSLLLCKQCTT